ncbi:MAG: cytochrome c biogenesis protein CcsA [Calditrichae bacterium]|nr:cytochrome c biogenesis protein CcsA [Calditrichota bacterium]MCB9058357.1 cytochrome c biogenesis protein CcsA [Calditrichia bacterium]
MLTLIQWIVFLVYALTTFFYWYDFITEKNGFEKKGFYTFAIAVLSHLGLLVYFIYDIGRLPIATVSEALGTFVWITASLYFLLELRWKERSHGVLILSVILILLGNSNLTFNISTEINPILYDVKFEIHVFAMLLGYSGFALSFIASILHLILAREIQKKEQGLFYRRLPSLAYFERISAAAINVGLLFTGIGFVLGYYFAAQVWNFKIYTDPKIIMVIVTWLIYFVHFIGRRMGKIRGQRAALISVIGFCLILFSFLIISTLVPGAHQFG